MPLDDLPSPGPWRSGERLGPAIAAAATFALHAACGGRYGVFRDELYFIACGDRLAAGYVDQPPLIAVVARAAHAAFGAWVPGLRLLPWIASALTAYAAGRLAVRLGGGAWAATLAGFAVATSPLLAGLGHDLTMNAFEPLLCLAVVWTLLGAIQTGSGALVVASGLLAGLATLNKYSAALFALCLVAGVLATRARSVVARQPGATALALALGLAVVLPNVVWQATHGFPFLELVRNGQLSKNAPFTLAGFAKALWLDPNPFAAPLWLAGLVWLLAADAARRFRFLGVAALAWFALLTATHAKAYYAAAVFPLLFAAGAVVWQSLLRRSRVAGAAAACVVVVGGTPGLPIALPMLAPEHLERYQDAIGVRPAPLERHAPSPLPQSAADQFGWDDLARGVADAYAQLTPAERAKAVVFGQNYGEAAAVEVLGPALGLDVPPAISGHNNYWLWGIPAGRGDVLLIVSDQDEDCGHGAYRRRDVAVKLRAIRWAMPYERARWIWICRDPVSPLRAIWASTRHYI